MQMGFEKEKKSKNQNLQDWSDDAREINRAIRPPLGPWSGISAKRWGFKLLSSYNERIKSVLPLVQPDAS